MEEPLDSYKAVTYRLAVREDTEAVLCEGHRGAGDAKIIKQAFKDKRFERLKMTEHSFQGYAGQWRSVNVNCNNTNLRFPLSPVAVICICPGPVTKWNTLKGGDDTVTKIAYFAKRGLTSGQINWLLAPVFFSILNMCFIDAIRCAT